MSLSKSKSESNEDDRFHPSEDRTGRFPKDRLLRIYGYRIHSRPKKGQAVWQREGILFPYAEALTRVEEMVREKASQNG